MLQRRTRDLQVFYLESDSADFAESFTLLSIIDWGYMIILKVTNGSSWSSCLFFAFTAIFVILSKFCFIVENEVGEGTWYGHKGGVGSVKNHKLFWFYFFETKEFFYDFNSEKKLLQFTHIDL